MTRGPQRWVIGGFILLAVFVTAFAVVSLLLSRGIGLPATFQVSPGEVTLRPGEGWQFRAVASGRLVRGVTWTATGGIIGPEGFYTAPDISGDYQVIAQHPNSEYRAAATVHVVIAEDVTTAPTNPTQPIEPVQPTDAPTTPSLPLTPTSAPPVSTPTQTPIPVPVIPLDDSGDLVNFDTLEPMDISPPGSDIRTACFAEGLHLVRAIPGELASEISDWDTEKNLILWITFHEPVPTVPDLERSWLFALDTDGNTATGRPLGDGVINPDIGTEVTIGVHSNPAAGIDLAPYMFIWNARIGNSESRKLGIEARLSTTRDALLVRVPAGLLADFIRTFSGAEPNWDQTVGRALAMATTSEGTTADFFPERP
jgi:hypothetical protein